jgi:hypothetical protein
MAKTKAHTRYRLDDGTVVPSVTTIINQNLGWNKAQLIAWARREALAGNDPDKIRDQAADRGTIAHGMIEELLTGKPFDRSEYAPADLEKAERSVEGFREWMSRYDLEVLETERALVHPVLRYGGTIDLLAMLDGKLAIIDFKTSKGVYATHRIQLAAYWELVVYHLLEGDLGHHFDAANVPYIMPWVSPSCHILHLDYRRGDFTHYPLGPLSHELEAFLHLLALEKLRKEIE